MIMDQSTARVKITDCPHQGEHEGQIGVVLASALAPEKSADVRLDDGTICRCLDWVEVGGMKPKMILSPALADRYLPDDDPRRTRELDLDFSLRDRSVRLRLPEALSLIDAEVVTGVIDYYLQRWKEGK